VIFYTPAELITITIKIAEKICHNFDQVEFEQNKNNERYSEPAIIRHEIVCLATETISEPQFYNESEHRGIIPEFAAKLFFRIKIEIRNRQNMDCEVHRQSDWLVP